MLGELLDVRTASVASGNINKRSPHANTREDAHLNPKDLPEYLQTLMEGPSKDLSTRGHEELAVAISEYNDVFSNGSEDMGQTDMVIRSPLTLESIILCAYHPNDFPSLYNM